LLGLIGADFYYNVKGDGSSPKLFKLDPAAPIENVSAQYPAIAAKMQQLCLGLYESARYVRYHNTPEDIARQSSDPMASLD